jgi:two-component system, NarL family, response regulator NreC
MAKIRVLLADDHAILRDGLRSLLSHQEDIQVVGEAKDGAEAVAGVHELHPDVVVMDIAMPGMNGLQATRKIREQYPETRVLVLTQHEDRQYVMSVLQAGAAGYVIKRAAGTDLITALRAVARGETFLYPSVATTLLEQVQRSGASGGSCVLTPREQEILKYIVQGKTNPQIAADLSLSVRTVDWHRTNLMSKLDLHTVADLVRYALQNGLAE